MATHYFGHGGLTEWADEQVLTTDDVVALGGGWKPTALFTWACLSQYYLGVDGPSLNESLAAAAGRRRPRELRARRDHAPGPPGAARRPPVRELRTPGVTLGEAIQRAKAATIAERPAAREVVEGFDLFGDPALVLYRRRRSRGRRGARPSPRPAGLGRAYTLASRAWTPSTSWPSARTRTTPSW